MVLPSNSYNVYNVLYCTLLPSTYPQLQCLYYLCCYTIYIPTHRISVYYCLRFLHSTYYTHTAYILCYASVNSNYFMYGSIKCTAMYCMYSVQYCIYGTTNSIVQYLQTAKGIYSGLQCLLTATAST